MRYAKTAFPTAEEIPMNKTRMFPAATVSKKAEAALRAGHPWVYADEIAAVDGETQNGCLIDIRSQKGAYLGTGFLSEHSKIRIRLLAANANETFGEAFFARRVKYALDYRRRVMGDDYACCRLIFGEADGLPGLTVDRYGELLTAEVLSYGMDRVKTWIYRALVKELEQDGVRVAGIFERNESPLRGLEGLDSGKGWVEADYVGHPESPRTFITENGLRYVVDVENGQKTGFFLDQKYNRAQAAKLAKGLRVLDCFTHTGSSGMNAALAGAASVTAVDVSAFAVETARENARLNGLEERMDFVCADVFDLLPDLLAKHEHYDYIILDPPAFTKSRRTMGHAESGYRQINSDAMKLLPRGGFLATCSCSHFMPAELFRRMLSDAAREAGVSLRLIEERRAAPDHPVLLNVPETDYLKFYLLQIV